MKTEFQLDYPTILANQARPVHLAIRFQAGQISQPRPRPAAFCVVLDRSGSMAGQPLAHAREATKLAVRNLRVGDQFGLVVFDNEAQTIIPLQPVTNKQAVCALIDQVTDGGQTNLTGGWMLGRDELAKAGKDASRRLLLLSDGQLNHGITEPAAVKQVVIAGLEQQFVRTSCLGFGEAYNEDLMAELARATNGQFYDAESPDKLPAIFASELEGLQKLTVQNLRLRIKGGDFCDAYALLGEYPSVALPDGRREFALGDLVSEEERIVCFAVQALPLPWLNGQPAVDLQGESLLEVEILWDEISDQGIESKSLAQIVRIQATQEPAQVVVNSVVAPWVSLQKAGAVAAEVNKQMDAGKHQEAIALLHKTVQEIAQYGPHGAEAAKVLSDLIAKISGGEWSLRERKSSRYRSASYRKMSSAELWSLKDPAPSFKPQPPPPAPPAAT